ncbi:unnamed protein product [Haemonchus placei]|uniref:CCDC66 domain-containing protein n=1 Tax=Haemonchus placei TaxID=6290 RepID=A0A0N4WE93_HAEPC|nr:unnamed protein product [Haemonchus placei]
MLSKVSEDRIPLTNSPNRAASLAHYTASTGSLPNLSKRIPSDAEQHKLDLLKQIEENKRRRQLELEKEKMEEQKEIERLERYNEKMRKEKEEEERKLRERARQAEKRNEQMYEPHPRPQRRRSSPPPPRKEQRRSPSPSEAPALEWWEKKPSWQQRKELRLANLHEKRINVLKRELLVERYSTQDPFDKINDTLQPVTILLLQWRITSHEKLLVHRIGVNKDHHLVQRKQIPVVPIGLRADLLLMQAQVLRRCLEEQAGRIRRYEHTCGR